MMTAPTESSQPMPRSGGRLKRILRYTSIAVVSVIALVFVANLVFRYSGSNQWELVREEKGVKVYALKMPGAEVEQFKVLLRVRSTLGGLVKFMQDTSVCADYGCYDSYTIERVDDELQYVTFRLNFPWPFQRREFVVRTQIHQNPQTKEVLLEYAATPDKLPPSDCCQRVTYMNNTFRFMPRGNGEVDIEYVQNMNEGGFMLPVLLNYARPRMMVKVMGVLQRLLEKHGYEVAKLDYVKEP